MRMRIEAEEGGEKSQSQTNVKEPRGSPESRWAMAWGRGCWVDDPTYESMSGADSCWVDDPTYGLRVRLIYA